MSSACRTSDGGGGGLEVLNHANEDVLFLTPNQDQEEEEEYEDKLETKEPEEESFETKNAHDLYLSQAQISLIVDASDINDDLNDSKPEQQSNINDNSSPKADLNGASKEDQNNHLNDINDNNGNRFENSNGQTVNAENKPHVDEGVMSEMKYLFKNTRYFLIKSNNFENIDLAKQKCVWSTPKINEIKLNKAYRECANVLLIFSVSESGRFQGYARLSSECIRDEDLQVNWILPPTLSARSLNGVFKIDWVTKNDLFFTKCAYINNPWNENKPVKVGRDGQEIEPHAGELLCRQFDFGIAPTGDQTGIPVGITENLDAILGKSKKRHEELVNEKEHQKGRHLDQDRDRRHRGRSSDRNGRSDEARTSSDRDQRDSDSSKQRANASGSSHQISSGYHHHRNDYQGNHNQVFSHKRNYHDGNNYRNYNDPPQRRYNNYQNDNNNFPYQQYPNMRNMNPYQQQQFYNQQMQPMYNGNMLNIHPQGMNQYQQPMQNNNMHPQMNMMYPQSQQMPPYQSSEYNRNDRNNNSSPKKQRMSNDFVPATKEIILKSQTYEEYLAAASNIQPQSVFDRLGGEPSDPTQYVNYEAIAANKSTSYSSSSKYEQDVEEFLRKTAGIPSQSTSSHSRYKSDEKSGSRRNHEKKSSSRDKDRDSYRRDRDSHRRDHRHGSHSSQERSTRRRSRDRK